MWQKCSIAHCSTINNIFAVVTTFPRKYLNCDFSVALLDISVFICIYNLSFYRICDIAVKVFTFYSKQKSQKTKRSNLLLSFLFYSKYFDHFSRNRKYHWCLGNTFRNMICVTNFHFVPSFVLIFSLDIWPSSASSNWSGAEWEQSISRCLVVVTVYECTVRLQTLVKGCVLRASGAWLASSYDFIQRVSGTHSAPILIDKVALIWA